MPILSPFNRIAPTLPATNVPAPSTQAPPPRKWHPRQIRENLPTTTLRERDVLALLIEGWTTKQMADALGLKPTTIRTYLERLYRKTHTRTRAALVWWWAQNEEGK